MTNYFNNDILVQAKTQRKKTLTVYFIILALYLAMSVVVLVRYLQLPFASPKITVLKTVEFVLTFIMFIFSFIYLGIKYKRVNKFYVMCKHMSTGLREENTASFFEYDESLSVKDGVDVKALVFLQWNKFKNEYFERKVWVFFEKPFPEFNQNDTVKFVTQGNMLISYQIIDEEN